ncbi:MAG TPA: ATP-binding protein [Ktedonobacteraceae bacterium]|nr:ATP-binding protein [Ktedonobacteraceae bacterium]
MSQHTWEQAAMARSNHAGKLSHKRIDYEQFFQQLLSAMPGPMLVIDEALVIHFANEQAAALFEVRASIEGTSFEQHIADPSILELVRRGIETNRSLREERLKSDTGQAWRISITPLAHAKNVQRVRFYAVVIEDFTELRRLERARRDFVANISHELRTPLASVRLLVETLEDAIDTDPEQAQVFVEKIEREVEHLNSLVSELLDLSRIESGQTPMNIEPVGAEQLVREVMARMLPQAQRHRVMLRTEIEQGSTRVAADVRLISRVLVNLAHNAIKFTPSGGTITLGTRRLNSTTQAFFVRDTGEGIPPEDLPRIFERFYKVNRARSKADFIGPGGGGSGLGLAIARHVVEAHGGRIKAESAVGQGSIFTFTLPISTLQS